MRIATGSSGRSTPSSPTATRSPARSGRSARRWSTTRSGRRRKRTLSLRGAQRRSNPVFALLPSGLLRFARNDDLPRPAAPHRRLEFLAELRQFIGAEIADRPVVQPPLAPAPDVETLNRFGSGAMLGASALRDEQVDDVAAPLVDHRAERAAVHIIEPAADQGKALGGEIDYRRRHVQPAVE